MFIAPKLSVTLIGFEKGQAQLLFQTGVLCANSYYYTMTHGRKTLLCLLGGLSVCALTVPTLGNTGDNPYKAIVDRNVFGLKPPPPPVDPNLEAAAKNPPPKITLTGITTILGNKRALMKTPPAAVKPGEQPREQSYILSEGQRDGDMEVVQIDEKTGSVKLVYAGTPITLTFEKDGPKAAPGGLPAPVGMPGGNRPFPGTDGGIRTLPTRTVRAGAPNAMVQPAAYQPTAYQPVQGGGYQPATATTTGGSAAQSSTSYQSGALASSAGTGLGNAGYGAPGVPNATGGISLTGSSAGQKLQPNWPPDLGLTREEQVALGLVQQAADPNLPGLPGVGNPSQQQQQQTQQ